MKRSSISTGIGAPIVQANLSPKPVLSVAVEPLDLADMPKLVDGLKKLALASPATQCVISETGALTVGATDEQQLKSCLQALEDHAAVALKTSEPIVSYLETVTGGSAIVMGKSPNKHNRLYMKASAMANALGDGELKNTTGAQYTKEIKEAVIAGFNWATREGVLCAEPTYGLRADLMDTILHADAIHRAFGQITPSTRRLVHGSMLAANPGLLEPVYLVQAESEDPDTLHAITKEITKRGGQFLESENGKITAYVNVRESLGFADTVKEISGDEDSFKVDVELDHWQLAPGNPLDGNSVAGRIVAETRLRKGLTPEIPAISELTDKL